MDAIMARWCERSTPFVFINTDSLLMVPDAVSIKRTASTMVAAYFLYTVVCALLAALIKLLIQIEMCNESLFHESGSWWSNSGTAKLLRGFDLGGACGSYVTSISQLAFSRFLLPQFFFPFLFFFTCASGCHAVSSVDTL